MLWCITTADEAEVASGDLDRFLESVSDQAVRVILILRDVSRSTASRLSAHNSVSRVVESPRCGLSTARNLGLRALAMTSVAPDDVIAFPDDDCWYPSDLAERVSSVMDLNRLDFLGGTYGEQDTRSPLTRRMTEEDALRGISSVGIFVRWELAKTVGAFNPALGAGSGVFGYGEDSDYAIRAFRAGSSALYYPGIRVIHAEERELLNRNPKGYLTVAFLNTSVVTSWVILFRGIAGAFLQDVLQLRLVKIPHIRLVLRALKPSSLNIAIQHKRTLSEFFE